MDDTIKVNFHTHSSLSDGADPPAALAEYLADADVRYAALTDHDTVEGQAKFRETLEARGIPSLTGLELTTQLDGRLVHLLAYGYDPEHSELLATLSQMRGARIPDVHSITGSLRAATTGRDATAATERVDLDANGVLQTAAGIDLIHRAGGRAFLAHPLVLDDDREQLSELVGRLQGIGLDGLEAVYAEYTDEDQAWLIGLAHTHALAVSAGTDYHGVSGLGSQFLGIRMTREEWVRFRDQVMRGSDLAASGPAGAAVPAPTVEPSSRAVSTAGRRSFVLRVVLPAAAALGLFLAALWLVILPSFESTLVDRKRELIRELTNSAASVLAAYQQDEAAGVLTREAAQAAAAAVVGELRYGPDNLDYFWIQDTSPAMVMHPYRRDLEGGDLSGFTDPRGVPIFVEFADLVEQQDDGYVDYVWQWFDDPERLEPKESYVQGFEPWGWVIGTGLYTDDVRAEIDRLERDLLLAALGVSAVIALLLFVVLQQSLGIERRREAGVERLRESGQRYHALAEATTEGTLLVVDGRCRYANPTMLAMLGYTAGQLEFLELSDVLPRTPDNAPLWQAVESGEPTSSVMGVARDGVVTTSDGAALESVLTLNPVVFGGQSGYILLARDVTGGPGLAEVGGLGTDAPAGTFRAKPARRGVFKELSPIAREILAGSSVPAAEQPALADLFVEPDGFGRLRSRLDADGHVRDYLLETKGPAGNRSILLSAALVRDAEGEPASIDGLLVDVTAVRGDAADRGVLLEQLAIAPLALQEPVARLGQPAVTIALDATLAEAARQMTDAATTAALVLGADDAVVGIVTDVDLRARGVAQGRAAGAPAQMVMTAPVLRIAADASALAALTLMEERSVRHLALEGASGEVTGLVDLATLVTASDLAPLASLRLLRAADSSAAVALAVERAMPVAVGLQDSSARPGHVTGLLTTVFDAATSRLVGLAIDEMGPPPAPFALFAMGSQGRGEVTFSSDQDHGIVFAETGDAEGAAAYFQQLGTHVRDGLSRAGYEPCRGGVMASEAAWCRSLPGWQETVDGWARRSEPQDITDLSVFLDFRCVHGDAELTSRLRQHVLATLPDRASVLHQLVRNALVFKPPMRLPGNIYLGGGAEGGEIDLKDAAQSLVAFARVYAVRHRIGRTHTLQRIAELADLGVLSESSHLEIADAYDTLMRLRLDAQANDIRAGHPLSSSVELASLTRTRQELMRQAFGQIAELQKRADADFPEAGS